MYHYWILSRALGVHDQHLDQEHVHFVVGHALRNETTPCNY